MAWLGAMSPVLWIVAALLAARLAGELLLALLNRRELDRHADAPPPAVAAIVDPATYPQSVAYTRARLRFGMTTEVFDAAVLALVVFSGLLPWLHALVLRHAPGTAWPGALFIVVAGTLLTLPGLPFDWYEHFRLESRFGFNKSTVGLWLGDKLKGFLLMLALGLPLLWLLLSLVRWVGGSWWLWGFAVLFGFQLAMMVLYPKLILPLFNKLTPLPEGDLRSRLMALADRTGFRARTIEVIDGSKRSGHSNAYFTGFGRFRRIVLFDTLLQQLQPEELEAVLAHEIGHYRCGHIPKMLAAAAAMQFAAFAAIAWLAGAPWFNPAFGFASGDLAPAFLLVGLLGGLATYWLTPLGNYLSRKHEYEADAFAREAMGSAAPLVGALRRLAQRNLSNLTPHPLYSGFHYSHPTIVERARALGNP
ncbi:protease HtpX [mine drainage metagenome]|uniref:Protease HtpX n=1 Tax=mine drainage metagenome TaxID=410659 RepID=A0A1J5SI68_9ZZZZ